MKNNLFDNIRRLILNEPPCHLVEPKEPLGAEQIRLSEQLDSIIEKTFADRPLIFFDVKI